MDRAASRNKLKCFMPEFVRVFTLLAVVFFCSACASVSVDKVQQADFPPAPPQHIYVQDFELPTEGVRVDRGGKALEDFRRNFKQQLTRALVERVNKRLRPSSALPDDADLPRAPAWLVTGRFVKVNQGSRALRAAIGFGVGGTKVETLVTVYDLSGPKPRPFLEFQTTGGTNAQPGAAVGLVLPNYYLLAADVVVKGLPGLSADVIRTSRQVVAVLSEYMAQENFLDTQKVSRAKKRGKWP
jgi:Domain of unknown function (DUF4410)